MMEGTVFVQIINALAEEAALNSAAWTPVLTACDTLQRTRTQKFIAQPFPYGSEMPWDSTGKGERGVLLQEGLY